jgi:hypothetical protein
LIVGSTYTLNVSVDMCSFSVSSVAMLTSSGLGCVLESISIIESLVFRACEPDSDDGRQTTSVRDVDDLQYTTNRSYIVRA